MSARILHGKALTNNTDRYAENNVELYNDEEPFFLVGLQCKNILYFFQSLFGTASMLRFE